MRGLLLAGGGQFGAYEAGACRLAMSKLRIGFDAYAGTSIGAYNAAYLAQFPGNEGAERLAHLWSSITTKDLYRPWRWGGPLAALWKPSLYDSTPARKLLRHNVDPSQIQRSGKKLRVTYVDLESGARRVADETSPDLLDEIFASGAFPGVLTPATVRGKLCIDGGVRDNAPLSSLLDAGCTQVLAIVPSTQALTPRRDSRWTALEIAIRSLQIMMNELVESDLRYCEKHANIKVIRPESQPDASLLKFTQQEIQSLMRLGFEDARRAFRG